MRSLEAYIQNTAERCFYKHFVQHLKDVEIKSILKEALVLDETIIGKIESIFERKASPYQEGFQIKILICLLALFTDLFALSFVFRSGQVKMPHYTNVLSKVSRLDIYEFFKECLFSETELHKKALALMLSKGLYDRPPKLEYPKSVEFIQHEPTLLNTWFGEKRPLNCLEMAELYQDIERRCNGFDSIDGVNTSNKR